MNGLRKIATLRKRQLVSFVALGFIIILAVSFFSRLSWKAFADAPEPHSLTEVPQDFTPAHDTIWDGVKEFFGWRGSPTQPIAFTHKKHIENQIECIACHKGVKQGPIAGLPSGRVCMRCHTFFAKDRPEIQKVKAIVDAGHDISWQRVYGFYPSAHIKFNHAPHINAGVECSTCHGDLAQMTAAVRAVNLNMGFCLRCHRSRQVSTDCVTCHY